MPRPFEINHAKSVNTLSPPGRPFIPFLRGPATPFGRFFSFLHRWFVSRAKGCTRQREKKKAAIYLGPFESNCESSKGNAWMSGLALPLVLKSLMLIVNENVPILVSFKKEISDVFIYFKSGEMWFSRGVISTSMRNEIRKLMILRDIV